MFYVFCSENLTYKLRLKAICPIEPTDEELEEMWNRFDLKVVSSGSDLIEVYEKEQIQEAFQITPEKLNIGDILEPNKRSSEDAINAYFP